MRGERTGIDGANRCPAQDIERDWAPDVLNHLGQDVHHYADFVGTPPGTAGQNQRYEPSPHSKILAWPPKLGPVLRWTDRTRSMRRRDPRGRRAVKMPRHERHQPKAAVLRR